MKKHTDKKENSGFSLLETIIVIAIIAVLIGIFTPIYIRNIEKSRVISDLQTMDELCITMEAIVTENDPYYSYYIAVLPKDQVGSDVVLVKPQKIAEMAESNGVILNDLYIHSKNAPWNKGYIVYFDRSAEESRIYLIKDSFDPSASITSLQTFDYKAYKYE